MGVAQFSLDNPVMKYTNALLAFTGSETVEQKEAACIRCGRCVAACPMSLLPLYINANAMSENIEDTVKYHVNDCIECGCCSYVCPASRHLVQSIRYAKAQLKSKAAIKKGGGK